MLKSRRFWIGLAATIVFMALFFWKVDFSDTLDALKQADYVYFIPAIALYFIAVVFRTLRWQFLLAPLGKFRFGRLFNVVVVGYMANNLLPLRLGELVRAYYIGEREKVSASASLATIVLERIFDGLALLLFLAVAAMGLARIEGVEVFGESSGLVSILAAALLTILFVGVIGLLTWIALVPSFGRRLAGWIARLAPGPVRPRVQGLVERFLDGLAALRSPRRQLGVFLLSLPVWLFEGAMYLVVSLSFGLQTDLTTTSLVLGTMFLVTATANLALSLPSSQGGIGPFELLTKLSLVLLGVADDKAAAYALALHVVLLAPVTLLGLAFLWRENISLAQLTRRGRVGTAASPKAGGV